LTKQRLPPASLRPGKLLKNEITAQGPLQPSLRQNPLVL
jgi:hypothetical protein